MTAAERLEAYARRIVATAPPLNDEQRHRLAALLRPTPTTTQIGQAA